MNAKVAKIISSKAIVINVGSQSHIHVGDRFEIIDKIGSENVVDPDSGQSLGKLTSIKGTVEVTRVLPEMSIAEPLRENINTLTPFDYRKDLNVDPKEITGGIPTSSKEPIKVGDSLMKVGK